MERKDVLIERAIQAYIKDFDQNNHRDSSSLRNETIKWTSAANFSENWDVDAEDLLTMWKHSTKKAFIDTSHSHPTQGITILLKKEEEQEGVRNAFRNLFQPDDGDIERKWERIQEFIEYINNRLEELYPNSKIYQQNKEAVITYLNLWDPDHNYRYKPQPANSWAAYIGYEDWESGQRFSLKKYYGMCDEILEKVKDHEELLRVHRQRFENGEPDCDKALHILTFDVLFCFWGYDDKREEALKEYEELQKQHRIDELTEQQSECEEEMEKLKAGIHPVLLTGLLVHHKQFGKGTVDHVDGGRIFIDFETSGQKKLQHPFTTVKGLLQFEDKAVDVTIKENWENEQAIELLQKQVEQLEKEISKIAEK